ncbi:LysR family transcriptional regulator [Chelatococcus asaccharovorans]|uniref:LysR family transcriptional regulator n=1 Tax=Chelatococcus asaccharovorans TaxID=28210 RepID=A0A2V3UBA8_9HYPH|nr:LysR family transcriptional regulator [Chelatococcus asaccharovorans]MBS7704489.1 LysR family transcriptional regulator [Chelatococcus asaccharovorans]PXW55630.1 LysR family transcriptional regulator [Chelatococcus asaccharovorans]
MVEPFKHLAWDDFRLVKAIADARGLPAAAAQIGVNHSTVFRRLGQIEEALGVKLFERHRAGYALTPAGEEIVAVAERVDADITAVTRKLVGRELAPAGELRVTTNDSLLVHLMTSLFARFREAYPTIQLDVVLTNQALNLSKRDADVAIRATDKPPENLVGRRISNVAWALYGRAIDFPDPETQRAADLSTLCNRTWVSLGDNLGSLNVVRFVRTHIAPENVGYKVNTVLGLAEAIEAGLGIGHLPCFIADARPSLVRLQSPDKEFETQLWLLTHPDLRHNARVRALMDFLAAEMSQCRRYMEGEAI